MTPYRRLAPVEATGFESEVIASPVPVLIAFGSESNRPSLKLVPLLQKMTSDYAGTYRIFGVDIDRERILTMAHGIRAVPTLIVYRGGRMVAMHTAGEFSERLILKLLEA